MNSSDNNPAKAGKRSIRHWTGSLQQFWVSEASLTFLLLVLSIFIFIVIPHVPYSLLGQIIFFTFYFLLLSSGLPFLRSTRRLFLVLLLVVAPIGLAFFEFIYGTSWAFVATDLFMVFYGSLLCVIILQRTFAQGPVTSRRIQGSVIVYLLLGLIFAMIYHAINIIWHFAAFKGLSSSNRQEFMYFSMTTLTTVGYGDISPAIPTARSFSNLEALIGQLYPAILIARLVSLEIMSNARK
ncbi:MAG TPA: potassium channel family protein [Puia sp.]|nr:potassium channel family protein [Puia sp.]